MSQLMRIAESLHKWCGAAMSHLQHGRRHVCATRAMPAVTSASAHPHINTNPCCPELAVVSAARAKPTPQTQEPPCTVQVLTATIAAANRPLCSAHIWKLVGALPTGQLQEHGMLLPRRWNGCRHTAQKPYTTHMEWLIALLAGAGTITTL
jgi:hypothetical protein